MLKKVRKKNAQDKVEFRAKLLNLMQNFPIIFTVGADNISTVQVQEVRKEIRGRGEVLFGKNTVIRKLIRDHLDENPQWAGLLPYVRGNIALVFTKSQHMLDIKEVLTKSQVPAAAKPGMYANADVWLPKGPTGLEPTKTAFLQALNIATKINKGQVEILNDVHLIQLGDKVGTSQASLCTMLGMKPFSYKFEFGVVYDDGVTYKVDSLNVTVPDIMKKFHAGVATLAALSLGTGIPTIASFPHSILNGFKNLLAISLETDYSFAAAEAAKNRVANPGAYVADTPQSTPAGGKPVQQKEKTPSEPSEKDSSGGGMGFSFFDSD
jgi:large subunit ribosomal protein LP0